MKKGKTLIQLQFTEKSTIELRGRQSVRTTFKLSERSIDALSILAGQLGIKQKSLFDHLVDDPQSLAAIAEQFERFPRSRSPVAKTYVISRKTLENLEKISSSYDTPRDALVELSIRRILPLIEQEKQKHAGRKEIVGKLLGQLQQLSRVCRQAEDELGEDDPVTSEMLSMLHNLQAGYDRLSVFLEKSKKIEDF